MRCTSSGNYTQKNQLALMKIILHAPAPAPARRNQPERQARKFITHFIFVPRPVFGRYAGRQQVRLGGERRLKTVGAGIVYGYRLDSGQSAQYSAHRHFCKYTNIKKDRSNTQYMEKRKAGGIRYKARRRGRSSSDSLAF